MTTLITSRENSVFRSLTDCLASKGIKKHGQFMIFGERAVQDTLDRASSAKLIRNIILCNTRHEHVPNGVAQSVSVLKVEPALFKELDVFGTDTPILVLNTPNLGGADLNQEPKGFEILAGLSDPSNLGSLIRSAAAFGVTKIVLLKESASPFHPKAVRAASAATLAISLERGPSIQDVPKLAPKGVLALDMKGEPLDRFQWPADCRLLIGEEGQGIPWASEFQRVAIPISPDVESLNATIAASIAMYAWKTRSRQ